MLQSSLRKNEKQLKQNIKATIIILPPAAFPVDHIGSKFVFIANCFDIHSTLIIQIIIFLTWLHLFRQTFKTLPPNESLWSVFSPLQLMMEEK